MKNLAWVCVWLAGFLAGNVVRHGLDFPTLVAIVFLAVASAMMHDYVLKGEQTDDPNEG